MEQIENWKGGREHQERSARQHGPAAEVAFSGGTQDTVISPSDQSAIEMAPDPYYDHTSAQETLDPEALDSFYRQRLLEDDQGWPVGTLPGARQQHARTSGENPYPTLRSDRPVPRTLNEVGRDALRGTMSRLTGRRYTPVRVRPEDTDPSRHSW